MATRAQLAWRRRASRNGSGPERSVLLVASVDQWPVAYGAVRADLGLTVVARTNSPSEALAAAARLRPDLVVVGPGAIGPRSEAAWIASVNHYPETRIVVVLARADSDRVGELLAAGASAVVLSDAPPGDLATAIRGSFRTTLYLANRVGGRSETFRNGSLLTPRESEILNLAAEGFTNLEIARKLWLSQATVKFHLSRVYRKLGVANRTQAVRWLSTDARPELPAFDGSDTREAGGATY